MVYQCVAEKGPFYAAADRKQFFTWRTPPSDSLIWIGRYEGYALFVENHRLSNPGIPDVLTEGSVTTFAIGRLVLQTFTAKRGFRGEGHRINVARKEGEWDRLLTQIWPVRDQVIRWPPPLSFGASEESLMQLAKRIGSEN